MTDLFARRADLYVPSAGRRVFDLGADPAYISLASGNPDTSLLPHEHLGELLSRIVADRGTQVLQYGSSEGIAALAPVVTELMAAVGARVGAENLVYTNGGSQGLDLAPRIFAEAGDVVLAEGPTFIGALNSFAGYDVEVRHLEVDDDGLDPAAVADAIDAARAEGRRVAFVYTIPNFQNGSGVTLSAERRQRLVDACAERGVIILEDDPYALISFPGQPTLPSLYSLNPDGVVYLGSFSKLFSPGIRLGWVAARPDLRQRFVVAAANEDVHPSSLAQELAAAYVGSDLWRSTLDASRRVYAERCAALLAELERVFPNGVTWSRPRGGFFTWLTFADRDPSTDFLTPAIEQKVLFMPGAGCYARPPQAAHIRLAFSNVPSERMGEAVRRIRAAVDAA